MPELPEVEVVRRALQASVLRRRIIAIDVYESRLRQPVDMVALRQLCQANITSLRRRSKYLLIDTDLKMSLLVHLGMSGRLRLVKQPLVRQKHDHIVWSLDDEQKLVFNDSRRFGLVLSMPQAALAHCSQLRHLGIEPLGPQFNTQWLWQHSRDCKQSVKALVMDQRKVVGVGNIYANEALYLAKLGPFRRASSLTWQECERLVVAVVAVLRSAIGKGGTTLRDFSSVLGEKGLFAPLLLVYGRANQGCQHCGQRIVKSMIAGRSSFYCQHCQH